MATISEEEWRGMEEILLTVSWGKEVMQPLRYHSIEIGPYQMSKRCKREDATSVAAEMRAEMEAMAEAEFAKKIDGFLDRVRRLNRTVNDAKSKGKAHAEESR